MGRPEEQLIRRNDAIRIIDELLERMTEDGCLTVIGDERVKELKEDLEKLPAVQPEPPWIPCSKKLPEMHDAGPMMKLLGIKEESKKVEISVKAGGVSSVISGWLRDGKWYSPELNAYVARKMNYEVTAWMPLPEPYEGSGDKGVGSE